MSKFNIVGLNYVSLYPADHAAAIKYYTKIFGLLDVQNPEDGVWGWRMGSTWLTVFPSKYGPVTDGTTQNIEFAIQMGQPDEVDKLYQAFVEAGVKASQPPVDTTMYEKMRYAYVDDPFGVRIDIYCTLPV